MASETQNMSEAEGFEARERKVRLYTTRGGRVRVCSRIANVVETEEVSGGGLSSSSRGFDPNWRLARRVDTYRVRPKEGLRLAGNRDERDRSVVEVVEAKKVGVARDLGGLSASFPKLEEELVMLREKCLFSARAARDTAAMIKSSFPALRGPSSPVDKLELYRFVRAWIRKHVPVRLLGGKDNFAAFCDNIKLLLGGGKACTIRLGRIADGLRIGSVSWLHAVGTACKSVPPATSALKRQTMAKLLSWLCQNVVWRLVLSFFHVTDTSGGRHELRFYRRRHFQKFFDSNLRQLESSGVLRRLSTNRSVDLQGRRAAPPEARARLFPKESGGCRVLTAARQKDGGREDEETESQAKTLLGLLKERHTEAVDVRGRALHERWAEMARIFLCKGRNKLYYVRVDVKDAYDSVDLDKLAQILLRKLSDREVAETSYVHTVRHVVVASASGGSTSVVSSKRISSKKTRSYSCPTGCVPLPVVSRPIPAGKLIRWAARRCRLHTLSFAVGRKDTRMRFLKLRGLVQGDPLSPALCGLYYGDMVRRAVEPALRARLTKGARRVFVRAVDDFAFVSTDRGEAEAFLEVMEAGFAAEYGCAVQAEKTRTNLRDDGAEFSFCGAIINAETMEVRPDYSSYLGGGSIVHSIKFAMTKKVTDQDFILKRMLFVCTQKLEPLFLDTSYNPRPVVLANLFESFHLLALRFDAMLDSLVFSRKQSNLLDFGFAVGVLEQCLRKVQRRLRSRRLREAAAGKAAAAASEVAFLYHRAFLGVALKRSCKYGRCFLRELRKRGRLGCVVGGTEETRRDLLAATRCIYARGSCSIASHGYQKLVGRRRRRGRTKT